MRIRIIHTTVLALLTLWAVEGTFAQSGGILPGQKDKPPVDELIESADEARDAKRFDEELSVLETAYRAYPDDVHILWRLTRASVEFGELTDSKDDRRRRFFEALRYGNQAIRADSMHHLGFIWLAVAEAAVASVEGLKTKVRLSWNIREHAEKAIELNPDFDSGYHILARWHHEVAGIGGVKRTLAQVFLGDLPEASYDEAIRLYRQAIEINDLINHRLALVRTLIKSGRTIEARREIGIILARPSEKRLDDKHKAEARELLARLD